VIQLALPCDAATAGASTWDLVLAWARRAADVIGHKELAYKLNVKGSNLTDALLERERKDIKARWLMVILSMVPPEMCAEFLRIIAESHGYEVRPIKIRTASEENREMRELLRVHAPSVLSLIDKEMGR